MIYPLIVVGLCLFCALALPYWVYDVHRWFDEPGSFDFGRAVVAMVATVVALEGGFDLVRQMWEKEVRERAPGESLPERNPVALLQGAILFEVQVVALMMFLTTMDGGLRWAATRWVYLTYAAPALVLVAVRWKRWTWPERLYLCWGWAPVLAFGVPFTLPRLLAAGLITNPWD
jgi:hypothetical protein